MNNDNSYKEFSQIYDLMMADIEYKKWTSFIIDKIGDGRKKILEAACGTGNITALLAEKNYKVTAFDLSGDMLVNAYEKVGRNPNVKLLNQNMVNFKIDERFNDAICCCDGINYLNREEVLLFFKNVGEHLTNKGKFIFDMSTEYKYKSLLRDTYVYDDEKIFYVWENMLDEEMAKLNLEINFFVKNSYDKYTRITEIQTQYIHDSDFIIKSLEKSGFEFISVYNDYNDELLNETSLRAVFYASKK